jgi:hypothetical protein
MPNARQRNEFDRFVMWCKLYDIDMPADGDEIAGYLLELLSDGATQARITDAADSILAVYDHHGVAIAVRPIKAALVLAAAQLAPNRTLN